MGLQGLVLFQLITLTRAITCCCYGGECHSMSFYGRTPSLVAWNPHIYEQHQLDAKSPLCSKVLRRFSSISGLNRLSGNRLKTVSPITLLYGFYVRNNASLSGFRFLFYPEVHTSNCYPSWKRSCFTRSSNFDDDDCGDMF